jgi:hypothetical protein
MADGRALIAEGGWLAAVGSELHALAPTPQSTVMNAATARAKSDGILRTALMGTTYSGE